MTMLAEFRAQYPQYDDMDDASLANSLHAKFYADVPRAEFDAKLGIQSALPANEPIEADGSAASMEAYLSAKPAKAPAKEPEGWLPWAEATARSAAMGLTFNTADDIAAFLGSLGAQLPGGNGKSRQEILDEINTGVEDFKETNPVTAYGTEIGASLILPAKGLKTAYDIGSKVVPVLGNVGKHAVAGSVIAAPYGAAQSAGNAISRPDASVESVIGETLEGAKDAAVAGAVLNPVIAGVAPKVVAGAQRLFGGKPGEIAEAAAPRLAEEAALPQEGAPQVSATPEPAVLPNPAEAVPPQAGPNTAKRAELPSYLSREFEAPGVPTADEVAEASARTGIPVSRVVASESGPLKRLGGFLADTMFVGTPLEKAADETRASMKAATEKVLRDFGSGERFNAGEAAATAVREWMADGSKETTSAIYQRVAKLFDRKAMSPLNKTREVAESLRREIQESTSQVNQKALDLVMEATTRPGGLTYDGLMKLRQDIGAHFDGSMIPEAGTPIPALKRIYGAMSDDLHQLVLQSGGSKALSAYMKAERVNQLTAAKREELGKLVGDVKGGATAPEEVADRILSWASGKSSGDLRQLLEVRKIAGPEAFDQLASYAVSKMGFAENGQFSPARFFAQYSNMTQNGRRMLFGSTGKGELKQALDDIATIAARAKDIDRFRNSSRTFSVGSGALGLMGAFFHPLNTLMTGAGGYMIARALAKPATAKHLSRWSQAREAFARTPNADTQRRYALMSRSLAMALADEGGDERAIAEHLITEGAN